MPFPTPSPIARLGAFSLVEITLALGLISFCLVAILGLLPVSLTTVYDANRQAEASRLLKQLATGIQGAVPDANGTTRMLGLGTVTTLEWTPGGTPPPVMTGMMTSFGVPTTTTDDATYIYRIELVPPADAWTSGRAMVRIAWPIQATWHQGAWVGAQGSVKSLVLFRAP